MWPSFLAFWRRRPRLEHLSFVLYTRQKCHLCAMARQQLEQAQRRYGFRLQALDVDQDAELAAKYGLLVPVVTVNGKVRFRGQVNRVLLERLLIAEQRC